MLSASPHKILIKLRFHLKINATEHHTVPHQVILSHILNVFGIDLNIQFKEVHVKKMTMRINQRLGKMFVFDKLTVMQRKYRMCLMIHKFQQIHILIHSCELIL